MRVPDDVGSNRVLLEFAVEIEIRLVLFY